ncbi:bacteriohemerythrin [Rhizomicrobium palustre]
MSGAFATFYTYSCNGNFSANLARIALPMAFMEWDNSYYTGVDIFDEEHKKLVAIINDLNAAQEAGCEKTELEFICARLVEYTALHFRHEEMYFAQCDYPEAEEHKGFHDALKAAVFAFRDRVQLENCPSVAEELAQFLRRWYHVHILVEDAKYARHLKEHAHLYARRPEL